MSNVRLDIGGRTYDLAVREGQEAKFRDLATFVDARCRDAARATGGLTEVRQFLFAALLLADEVQDARALAGETVALHARVAALTAEHDALRAERDALAAEITALRDTAVAPADPAIAIAIERLAARAETFADGLEKRGAAS